MINSSKGNNEKFTSKLMLSSDEDGMEFSQKNSQQLPEKLQFVNPAESAIRSQQNRVMIRQCRQSNQLVKNKNENKIHSLGQRMDDSVEDIEEVEDEPGLMYDSPDRMQIPNQK